MGAVVLLAGCAAQPYSQLAHEVRIQDFADHFLQAHGWRLEHPILCRSPWQPLARRFVAECAQGRCIYRSRMPVITDYIPDPVEIMVGKNPLDKIVLSTLIRRTRLMGR